MSTTQTPQELEAEIEAQREQLADTVDALAAKLDVKRQARIRAQELKQQAGARAQELRYQSAARAQQLKAQAGAHAQELGAAAAAAVALVVAWAIWKRSR